MANIEYCVPENWVRNLVTDIKTKSKNFPKGLTFNQEVDFILKHIDEIMPESEL